MLILAAEEFSQAVYLSTEVSEANKAAVLLIYTHTQ